MFSRFGTEVYRKLRSGIAFCVCQVDGLVGYYKPPFPSWERRLFLSEQITAKTGTDHWDMLLLRWSGPRGKGQKARRKEGYKKKTQQLF
jgi:hypothetical protein